MVMKKDLVAGLNARIYGSGKETIVLAHGYGGDQSVWDKIVPHLAARHRVLVFNWCFAGAVNDPTLYDAQRYCSYDGFAEDLISIVEEMKLESSVFVGHSMSGMIGCIAAIKRPDLFRSLVLVGATPRLINTEDYEGGFDMSEIEQIFTNIESNFEPWASSFASLVVDASDPLSKQFFENCLKRMRPEVALSVAKTVFLSDYRDILDKVLVPCHIIQTSNDIVVPNSVPRYMQSRIKVKCEINIIETNGHFPQLTSQVQFVDVLSRILDC